MSDEQHHNRARTAKSLAPPIRELLRMNRELCEEIRHAAEDTRRLSRTLAVITEALGRSSRAS